MFKKLSRKTRSAAVLIITAVLVVAILIGAKMGETRKTILTPDMIEELQLYNPEANGGK
ncbi:hypothetical protein FACS1894217_12790 [Clostridia bacterium]|nr:hypothetical protein FACS1894217_12790 [Clostridia bacterium]